MSYCTQLEMYALNEITEAFTWNAEMVCCCSSLLSDFQQSKGDIYLREGGIVEARWVYLERRCWPKPSNWGIPENLICLTNEVDFFNVRLLALRLNAEAQVILSLLGKYFSGWLVFIAKRIVVTVTLNNNKTYVWQSQRCYTDIFQILTKQATMENYNQIILSLQ